MNSKKLFYPVNIIFIMMITLSSSSQGNSNHEYYSSTKTVADSFSFCSLNFKIPPGCNQQEKNGQHSFVNEILKDLPMSHKEILSCNEGNLSWNYLKDIGTIETNIENLMAQLERQMLKFKKTAFTCTILNRDAAAYKLEMQPENEPVIHEIIAYSYVNGQYVLLELTSLKELKTSKTMEGPIGEIIQF